MSARHIARVLVAVTLTTLCAPVNITPAFAASCPDVEVTFARPTNEPPYPHSAMPGQAATFVAGHL